MRDSVLDAILDAIAPASAAAAEDAAIRLARVPERDAALVRLAQRLCAARHAARPAVSAIHVVVCAADHGVAGRRASGLRVVDEASDATVAAVRAVAAGHAAVNTIARSTGALVSVVDCGVIGPQPVAGGVLDLRIMDGTADIRRAPAMTVDQAHAAVHTGIALLLSLADAGLDCVALGQIAPGGQPVSAAVIAALLDCSADELDPGDRELVATVLSRCGPGATPLAVLADAGGPDLGVMAGIVLAAASLRIPVVLDDHGTSAAALLATRMAPHAAGYVIASHAGASRAHRLALRALDIEPLLDLGVSQGEGSGAALALPLIDSAARLLG